MTTNLLERAVIEAARKVMIEPVTDQDIVQVPRLTGRIMEMGDALAALDAAQDSAVTEIPWSQVVEGDELRSPKNGKFYEVERTGKGWASPAQQGQGYYKIVLKGIEAPIFRPRDGEPTAFVKRGATGNAVDTFIDVFSSGGK